MVYIRIFLLYNVGMLWEQWLRIVCQCDAFPPHLSSGGREQEKAWNRTNRRWTTWTNKVYTDVSLLYAAFKVAVHCWRHVLPFLTLENITLYMLIFFIVMLRYTNVKPRGTMLWYRAKKSTCFYSYKFGFCSFTKINLTPSVLS